MSEQLAHSIAPMHDQVEVDGVLQQTVSYLDDPFVVSPLGERNLERHMRATGLSRDEALARMQGFCIADRNVVMAFESDEAGLDIQRVRSFMARYGAPVKAFRVLDPDQYEAAHLAAHIPARDYERSIGHYLTEQDVALIERDEGAEAKFGVLDTEARVVHELAHAWADATLDNLSSLPDLTGGFVKSTNGHNALEEGWARYMAARYRQEFAAVTGASPAYSNHGDRMAKFRRIPVHDENKPQRESPSMYAASIIDRIVEKDPGFFQLMCEARTDAGKREQMRERMNRVKPGLYEELSSLDPDARTLDGHPTLEQLDKAVALRLNPAVRFVGRLASR